MISIPNEYKGLANQDIKDYKPSGKTEKHK